MFQASSYRGGLLNNDLTPAPILIDLVLWFDQSGEPQLLF